MNDTTKTARGPTKKPSKWLSPQTVASHLKAIGCTSKSDWSLMSSGSYQTCRVNKWINTVCELADISTVRKQKFGTVESIVEHVKALNINTLAEWAAMKDGSYVKALKLKCVGVVCESCQISRSRVYNSAQDVLNLLLQKQYVYRVDWIEDDPGSYTRCQQKGWMSYVVENYEFKNHYREWSSFDEMVEHVKSLRARSRNHWEYLDSGSYGAAKLREWVYLVCDACGIPRHFRVNSMNRNHKLYFTLVYKGSTQYLGYGISSMFRRRMSAHKRNAAAKGFTVIPLTTVEFDNGSEALSAEKLLKDTFAPVNTNIPGFITESCCIGKLTEALSLTRSVSAYLSNT